MALSFCVVGSAASNRRARGVTGIERIDELQHIADRAPAFGRSAPHLLLVPALCALSGRFLLLRRLFRKGNAGCFRVMHPKCVVARYVGEILQQALKADMLVVIAANCGRCVRSAKFCVLVVQHGHAARADSHAPLTDRADDRKIPVIQTDGHTVFPAIIQDGRLLFLILAEDGIAASAEPVSGIKRLRQGLERTDRLRGKAADEKTRLRVDDPAMTSFAVIKHEPHLPFRYGSMIAGAMYNNTDSPVLSGICYAEMQKNRLFRRLFQERWSECNYRISENADISTVCWQSARGIYSKNLKSQEHRRPNRTTGGVFINAGVSYRFNRAPRLVRLSPLNLIN